MKINRNIGNVDLAIRIIIFIVFAYLSCKVSAWFFLLAIWELFVIITKWCVVYDLLKINTLRKTKGGKKT